MTIDYLSNDDTALYINDLSEGYYYYSIKCWHDDINAFVISTRWLYGTSEDFSAGYTAVQEDGTVITEEKWTYEGALEYMERMLPSSWDVCYLTAMEHIVASAEGLCESTSSDFDYGLLNFVVESEGEFRFQTNLDYLPYRNQYDVEAKNYLPAKATRVDPEDDDYYLNHTKTFSFGAEIEKIYPTLENADNLEFVDPA